MLDPDLDLEDFVTARMPEFHFSTFELCFPSDAEAWVQRGFTQPWRPGGENPGVALFNVGLGATTFNEADVVAGSHFADGALLGIGAAGPGDIGSYTSIPEGRDLFVDACGWTPEGSGPDCNYTQGSIPRAMQFASPLSGALNPAMVMPQGMDPLIPGSAFQDMRPRIYAEIDWAGAMPRLAATAGMTDFTPGPGSTPGDPEHPRHIAPRTDFDDYLIVTYYLFYPFTDTSLASGLHTGGTTARDREGQWEAVSLYFKGVADLSALDEAGRPGFSFPTGPVPVDVQIPTHGLTAAFAAYSQGTVPDDPTLSDSRPLTNPLPGLPIRFGGSSGGSGLGARSVTPGNLMVFITAGTHKNLFTTNAVTTTTAGPPDAIDAAVSSTLGSIAGLVGGGCWATGPAAPFACAIGIVLAALAAFFSTLSILNEPQVTTTTETPAGPASDLTGPDGAFVWPIGVGGATAPEVRLINRFAGPPAAPSGAPLAPPAWWGFPGGWGVKVQASLISNWTSGTRRVDGLGRSWAYWNTVALQNLWDSHPPSVVPR